MKSDDIVELSMAFFLTSAGILMASVAYLLLTMGFQ